MSPAFWSLTVDLPEGASEFIEELLHSNGALGLEVRDSEAPPMPGVRGPCAGESIVIGFFDQASAAQAARAKAAAFFPGARIALDGVPSQDWANDWKRLIRPSVVGRLWVGPHWELASAPADKVRILIEPKMAFGTGDHPTTRLCLAAIDAFLERHPGATVLDVGAGTGILAIAARKLAAARALGIDTDPLAVSLARENAIENGAPEVEFSERWQEEWPAAFDLVVANILANALVELAPALAPRVGARLVLGGLLAPQAHEVATAYERLGLVPDGGDREGDWIRLDFRRG